VLFSTMIENFLVIFWELDPSNFYLVYY